MNITFRLGGPQGVLLPWETAMSVAQEAGRLFNLDRVDEFRALLYRHGLGDSTHYEAVRQIAFAHLFEPFPPGVVQSFLAETTARDALNLWKTYRRGDESLMSRIRGFDFSEIAKCEWQPDQHILEALYPFALLGNDQALRLLVSAARSYMDATKLFDQLIAESQSKGSAVELIVRLRQMGADGVGPLYRIIFLDDLPSGREDLSSRAVDALFELATEHFEALRALQVMISFGELGVRQRLSDFDFHRLLEFVKTGGNLYQLRGTIKTLVKLKQAGVPKAVDCLAGFADYLSEIARTTADVYLLESLCLLAKDETTPGDLKRKLVATLTSRDVQEIAAQKEIVQVDVVLRLLAELGHPLAGLVLEASLKRPLGQA